MAKILSLLLSMPIACASFSAEAIPGKVAELSKAVIVVESNQEWATILNYSTAIIIHNPLHEMFDRVLADMRVIPNHSQQRYGWEEKARTLSYAQLAYVVDKIPSLYPLIEAYEKRTTAANLARIKAELEAKTAELGPGFIANNLPDQPVVVKYKKGPAYSSMKGFISHPWLSDPNDPTSRVQKADDLLSEALKVVRSVEDDMWGNFYELDLIEFSEAIVEMLDSGKLQEGILGFDKHEHAEWTAINKKTGEAKRPFSAKAFKFLEEADRKNDRFAIYLVDSAKLNHQKQMAINVLTENAYVMQRSANLTHSCTDPNGECFALKPDQFTPELKERGKPNANNMLLVRGSLVAQIVAENVWHTVLHKLRGESRNGYPDFGVFLLPGPIDKRTGLEDFYSITFSPNGGQSGNVQEDILAPEIELFGLPNWIGMFGGTSDIVGHKIIELVTKEVKATGKIPDTRYISDTMFGTVQGGLALQLSALKVIKGKDKNGKEINLIVEDKNSALFKELTPSQLAKWRENIMINPELFGTFWPKLATGQKVKANRLLHHKIAVWFDKEKGLYYCTPGNSFNWSSSAEANQEQLPSIRSYEVCKKMAGGMAWIAAQKGTMPVAKYAEIINGRRQQGKSTGLGEAQICNDALTGNNVASKNPTRLRDHARKR